MIIAIFIISIFSLFFCFISFGYWIRIYKKLATIDKFMLFLIDKYKKGLSNDSTD